MSTLDDYEEGELRARVRRHWWQFWLPISVSAGYYTRIGNVVQLHVRFKEGYVVARSITGLPFPQEKRP